MAWCTLYSWFHCVCLLFLKDLSLVSASPNKLGSFLEDLCKLKSFISTAAPSLTGFTGQLPTEYFLFFLYICLLENIIQNTKEVLNLCQFSFVCWKALWVCSRFFLHYALPANKKKLHSMLSLWLPLFNCNESTTNPNHTFLKNWDHRKIRNILFSFSSLLLNQEEKARCI